MKVEAAKNILISYLIFLNTLQIAVWVSSLLQYPILSSRAALIITSAGLLAIAFLFKSFPSFLDAYKDHRSYPFKVCLIHILITPAIFLSLLFLIAYIKPDLTWDGNVYHIPSIGIWSKLGFIHWSNEPFHSIDLINGYPKSFEVISFLLAIATGNSAVINITNIIFIPVGVLGIYIICAVLGASYFPSLIFSLAYTFLPVVVNQSGTTYVDSAFASCCISAFALFLYSLEKTFSYKNALILGAIVGLAIGIKQTGIVLILIFFITIFFRLNYKNNNLYRAGIEIIIFMITVLFLGGGWYIRNFIYTGSPLFPAGIYLFGIEIFKGVKVEDLLVMNSSTPSIIADLPKIIQIFYTWMQGFSKWPFSIFGEDSRLGGIGFLWLVVCVPSILITSYLTFIKNTVKAHHFIFLAGMVFFLFCLTPLNWWARYTTWVYACGLPCAAIVWTQCNKKSTKIWMSTGLFIAMIEASLCFLFLIRAPVNQPLNFPENLLNLSNIELPLYPEESYSFSEALRGHESIAIGPLSGDKCRIMGNLSLPLGKRHLIPVTHPISKESIKSLKEQKVNWIIWDKHYPTTSIDPFLNRSAETKQFLLLNL